MNPEGQRIVHIVFVYDNGNLMIESQRPHAGASSFEVRRYYHIGGLLTQQTKWHDLSEIEQIVPLCMDLYSMIL